MTHIIIPTGVNDERIAIRISAVYQILRLNWYFSIFMTNSKAMMRPSGMACTTNGPSSSGVFNRSHSALSTMKTTNFKKKALSFSYIRSLPLRLKSSSDLERFRAYVLLFCFCIMLIVARAAKNRNKLLALLALLVHNGNK